MIAVLRWTCDCGIEVGSGDCGKDCGTEVDSETDCAVEVASDVKIAAEGVEDAFS